MSENKRVYHVKDLIIKADNVYVEREENHHHRRDPFFGRQHDRDEVEGERDFNKEEEHHHEEVEEKEGNRRRNRRPFWF